MARMPEAEWLGEHSPRTPMTRYDVVCVHTIVGYAPAHAAHFSVKANGKIQQSRDTAYRSAANLEGNHRVIAIENEDHGSAFGNWSGSDVPALTPEQVEANARILRWAHETHGIPLQMCPDSRPTSRGLGYHRQGIDGNFTDGFRGRASGGETWTEHFGKVCPGRNRIAQLPQILNLARDPQEDDDMPAYRDWPQDDKDALAKDIVDALFARTVSALRWNGERTKISVRQVFGRAANTGIIVANRTDDVLAKIDGLNEGGDASPRS